MRENAHIVRLHWNPLQVRVTIPKHIAQAFGLFKTGYAAFTVNEAGQLTIAPHPPQDATHGQPALAPLFDRSAGQPSPSGD